MITRSELAALRADDSPQRRAQHRLVAQSNARRETGLGAVLEAELAHFAADCPLGDLPALQAMFTPGDAMARHYVGGAVDWLLTELSAVPLGQVPLRHSCDRALSTLLLARCHGATLVLQAIDGTGLRRKPAPVSASFAANETWDHVLAGSATAELVRIGGQHAGGVELERSRVAVGAGQVSHRLGHECVQILQDVAGVLVTLKLQRRSSRSGVTREYALQDGRLLHQAAGSPRDSRLELTAAVLGRMGRRDAAHLLAAMAEERGSAHLRWQALRECLGLDTALGFAALTELAQRLDDPLAVPAGALRAQLLESHPQLAGAAPCPV